MLIRLRHADSALRNPDRPDLRTHCGALARIRPPFLPQAALQG